MPQEEPRRGTYSPIARGNPEAVLELHNQITKERLQAYSLLKHLARDSTLLKPAGYDSLQDATEKIVKKTEDRINKLIDALPDSEL